MDWNWFFSALAQSTAAIVGIFAAFIITKIINNQSDFKKKCSELNALLADCHNLVDKANNRYFEWYNKHTRDGELERINQFILENDSDDPAFYYDELTFSEYDHKTTILEIIASKIMEFRTHNIHPESQIVNPRPLPVLSSDYLRQANVKL